MQRISALSYAVRRRVILKNLGRLLLLLAALSAVVLPVSLFFGEYDMTARYGALVAMLAAVGFLLGLIDAPANVQPNEALVLSALVFLAASVAQAWPMTAAGLTPSDAFFESVSAVTTTGLSTIISVSEKSRTLLFARAWSQWVGGLGIVVLSVALLFRPGKAAQRLMALEESDDILSSTYHHARRVLAVYVIMTITGFLGLVALGADGFPAITHALAAVSTGGFSSYDNSLAGFPNILARAGVTALSFAGAVSLSLYYVLPRQGWKALRKAVEVRSLLAAGLIATVLLALTMGFRSAMPWSEVFREAPLMALSAQTTAGFSSVNVGDLNPASKLVLILSMIVGGTVGSTAGGMKIFRILIFLSILRMSIMRSRLAEHTVLEPRLGGARLESREIENALLLIVLFVAVIFLSWLPFLVMGYAPLDSLFDVVSATGTVGLSTGVTSSELPVLLKGILCADMLLGRLEIFAFLVLFAPGTWLGRRNSAS